MPITVTLPTGGTSTNSVSAGSTVTQSKSANLGLVRSTVGDILGFQGKSLEYAADAQAQQTQAAGYDAETAAYGSSERIARQNAIYADVSGNITALQANREALLAAGGQRASLAGAGFHGDADIVQSTLRQGYLQDQIARTQSNFEQSGYLEQAAASSAQSAAAGVAKQSALDLGNIYNAAGAQASTYAANATAGLSDYLSQFKLKNTTAEGLLSGRDIGTELATAPQVTDTSTTGTSATSAPVNQYTWQGSWDDSPASPNYGYTFTRKDNPAFAAGLSPQQQAVLQPPAATPGI